MKFSVDRQDKYTIIKLDEEKLDTTIAPEVKSELVKLESDGVENLIINLGNVKYSDSSGLSALLVANRLFGNKGSFVLCEVQEHVLKLIKISQLHKVMEITPTQEEAVDMVFMNALEKGFNDESAE
ncbi:MAG: STAS domain-containing protein [Cytophagales bacterium]|nr:STAS domain-containing protein [Cytophagales bacterium]